mgnify:CR=1 FL=1
MSAATAPIGPFVGINNRLPDHQLGIVERGRKAGNYLRNAVNVDLTAAGTLQRRKGSALAQAGTDCHSLWSDGGTAFYVDGGTLYQYPRTALRSGLVPGRRVSYCETPAGDVIWSNGTVMERIRAGASAPLGLAVPNPAPTVTASMGGGLHAGVYQVAITATNADGEESGATWPVQVSVADSGRIEITGLPGGMTNIYASPVNGDALYLAATTTASSYIIPIMGMLGQSLQTLGLQPMPAGEIVREHGGRLLVSSNSTIYYSEPFGYGLHNPLRGRIHFGDRITLLAPVQDGCYVGTETATFWLPGGDIEKTEIVELLPYGAVPGTDVEIEDRAGLAWMSARGLVVADAAGQAKNVQEGDVSIGSARVGATLYRDQDGMRQFIAALSGVIETSAPAANYLSADAARKESML